MFESPANIYYKTRLFYMVAKTMAQEKSCQECDQENQCQEAYRRLGDTKSPSVVLKAVVAFLLPLTVFIAALAAFEGILAGAINTKGLRTALSFLLALMVTAVCILIIKAKRKNITPPRGRG